MHHGGSKLINFMANNSKFKNVVGPAFSCCELTPRKMVLGPPMQIGFSCASIRSSWVKYVQTKMNLRRLYVIKYEEIENDEEIKSVVILKERFIRINYAGKG